MIIRNIYNSVITPYLVQIWKNTVLQMSVFTLVLQSVGDGIIHQSQGDHYLSKIRVCPKWNILQPKILYLKFLLYQLNRFFYTVCYYHVTYQFQIESTLCDSPECQRNSFLEAGAVPEV